MANLANQPFLQILNTYSITLKNEFKKYLLLYYLIVVLLNLIVGVLLYYFGDFIISILSNATYATEHTLVLIYIMFLLYFLYLMIYPIRQHIVLNKNILANNRALLISIIILLMSTLIFIPLYKTYAMSIIQPLGLILPIILTTFLVISKRKSEKK